MKRLRPWEVVALVGLAVHRFGEEHLGHPWTREETEGLRDALAAPAGVAATELDLGRLAREVALLVAGASAEGLLPGATGALKTLAALASSVSHKLPLGLPDRAGLPDQDPQVQGLKVAVARHLERLRSEYGRDVLLVVDGLDRGDRELAKRLFEDSQLLADLPCHLVICAPPTLRHRNVRGFEPRPICNIPVVDFDAAPEPGSGTGFFWELWVARTSAAGLASDLATRPDVERLGWASGGFVRTFLEMLQDTVEAAWDDDSSLTSAHVEAVVDRWRRRWEEDVHLNWRTALEQIANSRILDGSDLHLELVEQRCAVAFPNESIWYYPHPLLTVRAVATGP